jgi:sugar transferase EpsL
MTVHLTPPADVPSLSTGLGVFKRLFDIIASASALLLLSPVLLLVALLVRFKLGAPVLFTQERIGLNGQRFLIYKFRSMLPQGPGREDDASRLTSFGRKLRATSLDELPELWNVLNGTMSLVGPRPLLVEYLPLYSARQAKRHDVRPGLTGHAQVNGRNSVEWDTRLEMDVWYVENRSMWLDIKIILKTIQVAFGGRGVSAEGNATMPRFTGSQQQDKADKPAQGSD